MKPKLFIGSSREGLAVAQAIHSKLQRHVECRTWSDDVFVLAHDLREDFEAQLASSDFAAFVFSADDKLVSRGATSSAARDNVIYEASLFAGRLGFERCFIAAPSRRR